jgi:hypothetical protein
MVPLSGIREVGSKGMRMSAVEGDADVGEQFRYAAA